MSMPASLELIRPIASSDSRGAPVGIAVEVPAGRTLLVLHQGKVADARPPGSYVLGPEWVPRAQVVPASVGGQKILSEVTLYLLRTELITNCPWTSVIPYPSGPWRALLRCHAQGRITFQLTDPRVFFEGLFKELREVGQDQGMQSFKLAQPSRNGVSFATEHIGSMADGVIQNLAVTSTIEECSRTPPRNLGTGTMVSSLPADQQMRILAQLARDAPTLGITVTDYHLDRLSRPEPVPCAACGTVGKVTGKGTFHWNVSLFVVRYQGSKEGPFCKACALVSWLGSTALTVVAGWWGVIGLLVSPFLIMINLYHLLHILCRQRTDYHS